MPDSPLESLPEDWQEEVKALRRQKGSAQKYLGEYKEKWEQAQPLLEAANEKLTKAQQLEEALAQATTALSTKDFELAKIQAAHAAKLDIGFASRLQGTTAEELKADAESLASQFGGGQAPPAFVDASQGKGPGGPGKVEPLNSGNFAEDLSAALINMDSGDAA